jgi:plasmid stabilization system protein ParE
VISASYALTSRAEQDMTDVVTAWASPDKQQHTLSMLEHAFDLIAAMPHIGRARPEWTATPVRFWWTGEYWVVYRSDTTPIHIVAVLHGARDVAALLLDR